MRLNMRLLSGFQRAPSMALHGARNTGAAADAPASSRWVAVAVFFGAAASAGAAPAALGRAPAAAGRAPLGTTVGPVSPDVPHPARLPPCSELLSLARRTGTQRQTQNLLFLPPANLASLPQKNPASLLSENSASLLPGNRASLEPLSLASSKQPPTVAPPLPECKRGVKRRGEAVSEARGAKSARRSDVKSAGRQTASVATKAKPARTSASSVQPSSLPTMPAEWTDQSGVSPYKKNPRREARERFEPSELGEQEMHAVDHFLRAVPSQWRPAAPPMISEYCSKKVDGQAPDKRWRSLTLKFNKSVKTAVRGVIYIAAEVLAVYTPTYVRTFRAGGRIVTDALCAPPEVLRRFGWLRDAFPHVDQWWRQGLRSFFTCLSHLETSRAPPPVVSKVPWSFVPAGDDDDDNDILSFLAEGGDSAPENSIEASDTLSSLPVLSSADVEACLKICSKDEVRVRGRAGSSTGDAANEGANERSMRFETLQLALPSEGAGCPTTTALSVPSASVKGDIATVRDYDVTYSAGNPASPSSPEEAPQQPLLDIALKTSYHHREKAGSRKEEAKFWMIQFGRLMRLFIPFSCTWAIVGSRVIFYRVSASKPVAEVVSELGRVFVQNFSAIAAALPQCSASSFNQFPAWDLFEPHLRTLKAYTQLNSDELWSIRTAWNLTLLRLREKCIASPSILESPRFRSKRKSQLTRVIESVVFLCSSLEGEDRSAHCAP